MKKVMYGLCALMMCAMFAACGSKDGKDKDAKDGDEKGGNKIEALTEDLKNAKDWDSDQFQKFFNDYLDAQIEFLMAEPTEEGYKEFEKINDDFEKAMNDLDEDTQKTFGMAVLGMMTDEKFEKKVKEMEKLAKKWEEKFGKKMEDEDSEDANEELYPDEDEDLFPADEEDPDDIDIEEEEGI